MDEEETKMMSNRAGEPTAMVVGVSYSTKLQQRSLPNVAQSQNNSSSTHKNQSFGQKAPEQLRTPRGNLLVESKGKAVGKGGRRLTNVKKESTAITAN